MVYCGKPSKGCQMCRTRRIKCDETKPTCNQCAKSRRKCPGYRDEFDLVFRNETQATERRARKASKKPHTNSPARSGKDSLVSPMIIQDNIGSLLGQSIIPTLSVSVEHQASCRFVSNFILEPRDGSARGFMDFVIPLLRQEPQGHLRYAFNACSIAFLNNRGGVGGRFSDRALHEYTKALNGTNAALRNPETQLADSTLAAVLLLGLFESITAKQIGMLNWGSHTEGAIQLVKARGKKQLKTKVGLSLFSAVRTQMIIHSLTSGTAPTMGTKWWIDDAVRDSTAGKCHRLMMKTGVLRAEIAQLMNSNIAHYQHTRSPPSSPLDAMRDMIRRVQAVDDEVVGWMRDVPPEWRYRTVAWVSAAACGDDLGNAEAFPGRVDMYHDFYISSVWNTARTARLILASLIVRCAAWSCRPVDYRTTPEYAAAARTCVDIITDVIASVPYHLGWHLGGGRRRREQVREAVGDFYGDGHEERGEGEEGSHVKALAGYFLTWPLICLISQDYTTDAQRAWIHGRLRFIGDELGVKYAHILRRLQIRMPSMFIRRDSFMARPYLHPPPPPCPLPGLTKEDYLQLVHGRRAGTGFGPGLGAGLGQGGGIGGMPSSLPPGAVVSGAYLGQGGNSSSTTTYNDNTHDQNSTNTGGGDSGDPLRHVEAMQKERFEKTRAELLARAAGGTNAGEGQRWVAERWLVV